MPGLWGQNDDWEDPGDEKFCGNVNNGQIDAAGVSVFCGLLGQLCWGPQLKVATIESDSEVILSSFTSALALIFLFLPCLLALVDRLNSLPDYTLPLIPIYGLVLPVITKGNPLKSFSRSCHLHFWPLIERLPESREQTSNLWEVVTHVYQMSCKA